jgi:dephospho-CoA kinase
MGKRKIIIGILGGVCSGKSTAAAEFVRLGCGLIDADEIAHEVIGQEHIAGEIVKAFGSGVCDSNGRIDRTRLGERVFESKAAVEKLNSIVHPPVLARCEELLSELNEDRAVKAIALDMPLLVEVGWKKRCDKLIFVACREDVKAQRTAKKGVSWKNLQKKRENFQISLDMKSKIADYIVENNSDLSTMSNQVIKIFTTIINNE